MYGDGGRTGWDGRYFVTLRLPDGREVRQDAAKPLPKGGCTIIGTDNGMSERYRRPSHVARPPFGWPL